MEIRRAEKKDIGRLGELLEQVLEVHFLGRPDIFKKGTRKYTDAELAGILGDDRGPVFVCDDGGEVLGYAFCVFRETPESSNLRARRELYVDDLCVDASHRRAGIGTALFEHVARLAREAGCSAVTLNVWHLNPGAAAFYEKLGMLPRRTEMEMRL